MVPGYLAYLSSLFAIVEWEKPYFTWSCLGSSVVCLISETSMAFFFFTKNVKLKQANLYFVDLWTGCYGENGENWPDCAAKPQG